MPETTSMSSVVTALTSILTTDAMFTNLAALIPVVGGVLIFAFTLTILVWVHCEMYINKSREFGKPLYS